MMPSPTFKGHRAVRNLGRLRDRERYLVASEHRWRAAFDGAPVGMAEMDLEGRVLRVNPALVEIMGVTSDALIGHNLYEHYHPDEHNDAQAHTDAIAGGRPRRGANERRLPSAAGQQQRWISAHATRIDGADATLDRMLVHVVDISAEKQQAALLEGAYARFSALVRHSSDAITVITAGGTMSYASPAFAVLTGSPLSTGVGLNLVALVHPDDRASFRRGVQSLAADGDIATLNSRIRHGDAGWRDVEASLSHHLGDPAVNGIVVNLRDVTERVEAAAHLAHQAMHDTLTNLPNRSLLLDRLGRALARAERSHEPCALLFIDLDRFKEINDSLGHAAGDCVLIEVAGRLSSVIRPSDSVARLGGDEFVILAENSLALSAQRIAERVRGVLTEPIVVAGRTVTVGCSIGIAVSDHHAPEALLQEADLALYRAKGAGRNRWELYDQAMRTQAQRRLHTEQLLRNAVAGEGLVVHYQPIVDLGSGRITGTEALARIREADGSLVPPDEFIPIAEDSRLIVPLGAAVLREACRQQVRWRDGDTGMTHVAVNVSARQLSSPGFATQVAGILDEVGLDPGMLCIELTESGLIDAGTSAQKEILALKALGVILALDDFGTGWSSLAYLRRFPFDVVKIDRSFVAGLGVEVGDTEVVRAVIGLGQALGMRTLAEGIETEAQSLLLTELGCDQAQGYLYGRPGDPGDL
jgi:diguanylate cyclase (GGDEF)-like protein/PAS domain S-box-containing protein